MPPLDVEALRRNLAAAAAVSRSYEQGLTSTLLAARPEWRQAAATGVPALPSPLPEEEGEGRGVRASSSTVTEEQVEAMLARSPLGAKLGRWISVGQGTQAAVRLNWVASLMAVVILWGFAIACIVSEQAADDFAQGKTWVTQNWTWLYIATQNVWCVFLVYLALSRFGHVKLGADDEAPRFNDFTWFSMLFTCGVAVGLYVFGVQEPLYYYRTRSDQLAYSSVPEKTNVDTDAQRAQQAIFMACFHWGVHGWAPYILLALLVGVVSFRWGLPMTIRACFYPLIGDHALGLVGDLIDALSISTTTFGVCTSLGLGVKQLATGLQFLRDIGCSAEDNCVAAGGIWDLTKHGADNCFCDTGVPGATALWGDAACTIQNVPLQDCRLGWLKGDEYHLNQALYTIIGLVTAVATASVLSGLDRGIKTLASIAFTLGAVVWLTVLYADNTWYLMNCAVQTTGYYAAWLVQVSFDCDTFPQLGAEIGGQGPNLLWGSDGATAAPAKLAAAGFADPAAPTVLCGTPNVCETGIVAMTLAAALYHAAQPGATGKQAAAGLAATRALRAHRMSDRSIATTRELYADLLAAYGPTAVDPLTGAGVPCGDDAAAALRNGTHVDAYVADHFDWNGAQAGDALCATATNQTACDALWAPRQPWEKPRFPRCPEARVADTDEWGSCTAYAQTCTLNKAFYEEHDSRYMDWWTIFYWAWCGLCIGARVRVRMRTAPNKP